MRFVVLLLLIGIGALPAVAQPETFAYRTVEGVAADLLSLDVYRVDEDVHGAGPHPVALYVHGGGWQAGDKGRVHEKATWFTAHGYVFASVNYRLSPFPSELANPDRITFPTHPQDVAAALAYIHADAADWGGDAERIGLLGHSAGAHLATLVGADGTLQTDAGLSVPIVRAVLSLDTGVLDVAYWMDTHVSPSARSLYVNAFTEDRVLWTAASPSTHLDAADPPVLVVHQATFARRDASRRFQAAAQAVGIAADRFEAEGMDHSAINHLLGSDDPLATTYNATVLAFFERHVRGEPVANEPPKRTGASSPTLYPNPADTSVRLGLDAGRTYRITVADLLGRHPLRVRLRGDELLDVRTLPPGRYIVRVTDLHTRERSRHLLTVAR